MTLKARQMHGRVDNAFDSLVQVCLVVSRQHLELGTEDDQQQHSMGLQ